ncbi:hypothetical protein BC828DRAFT_368324, partial [Blastocladiella britannica]
MPPQRRTTTSASASATTTTATLAMGANNNHAAASTAIARLPSAGIIVERRYDAAAYANSVQAANTRRRLKIQLIKEDRTRAVTLVKRKAGLMKKAFELSVLCGCEIGLVIFGPNGKLFEYASAGNIESTLLRYAEYTQPHESKTNSDFYGEDGMSTVESDDEAPSPPAMRRTQQFTAVQVAAAVAPTPPPAHHHHHHMHQQYQQQQQYVDGMQVHQQQHQQHYAQPPQHQQQQQQAVYDSQWATHQQQQHQQHQQQQYIEPQPAAAYDMYGNPVAPPSLVGTQQHQQQQ